MSKKRAYSDPHNNANQSLIKRLYGGLEVVESKADLIVQPQAVDIKKAVKNDPRNCIFSRACQRMYGSKAVLFFGTVAYVDLLCEDGKRRVHRFMLGSEAKQFIRSFDDDLPMAPRGFRLIAPSPGQTLEGGKKHDKVKRARKRQALLKGETLAPRAKTGPTKEPRFARLSAARNGKGMVHFPEQRQKEPA